MATSSTAKLGESGATVAKPPAGPADAHETVKVETGGKDPVEARYSAEFDRCMSTGDAAAQIGQAEVECARAETELQDKKLNAEYRKAAAGLEPEQRPKLREAQRAWIAYRDLKCRSGNQTGGSADYTGEADCLLYETGRRAIELEDMQQSLEAPPKAGPDPVMARYSKAYDACMKTGDAAKGQTLAMVECASAEIDRQDKGLNAAYRAALKTLAPEKQPKLREAERAWLAFRDARCASENQSGGTIDNILIGACVLHETVRRTMELEKMR